MPERRSPRRRWLTALLASLLAHALPLLLLAWLRPVRPLPREKPRPEAIRVTYRTRVPPSAVLPPAKAAPAAPPKTPVETGPRTRPPTPSKDLPSPPLTAHLPPKPTPPLPASPPEASSEASNAAPSTDVPPARAENLPMDAPRLETARAQLVPSLDLPVASPPPTAPPGLHAPSLPHDLVAEAVSETLARGKVDRGLVHPYYSQVGKALLKAWNPDKAMTRKGLKGFLEQGGENAKVWSRIWLENAQAYGATGAAIQNTGGVDRLLPGGDDGLLARDALRRKVREQFRATRRATLRVVQDREGRLLEVTLVTPSNDAETDREAVADVRQAAQALPPPPPDALGDKQTLVSLWQFELIISISPPLPTFSFEFDEALHFADVRLPLDRRVYKRVRLLSAE